MFSLSLDTSTDLILLALFQEDRLIASVEISHQNHLSTILLPQIEKILSENNVKIQKISTIFVGIGPGSYTGTRIAVATANALAISCNASLYSFESPLAFLPPSLPDGPFTFLVPGKHTPCFLLQGSIEKGLISGAISHTFLSEESLTPLLATIPSLIIFSKNLELNLPENTKMYQASPNISCLVSYLNILNKHPPLPLKILYLHNP